MTHKSQSKTCQRGMTLIELLVAVACLGLVLAGVYHVFFTQSLSTTAETNILEAQTNGRAGMERITNLLRHAGYGCRDSFAAGRTMSGNAPGGGAVTVNAILWNIVDNNASGTPANADSVDVVHGFRLAGIVSANATDTNDVNYNATASGPDISTTTNFHNYVCFFPHMEGDVFYRVTADTGTKLTLNREVRRVDAGADVFMVSPTRIALDTADGDLLLQIFAAGYNWEVATGFQDLQFVYTEDGTAWSGTPANPNKVVGVRVWLLVRSEREDPTYTDTRTYTYAGQTVGPFNDHYHRWLIEETVWLRNKIAD